jgi:hypothetical protein
MIDIDAERRRAISKIRSTEGEEKEAWLHVCGIVLALECCMGYWEHGNDLGKLSRGDLFDDLNNQLHDAVHEAVKRA